MKERKKSTSNWFKTVIFHLVHCYVYSVICTLFIVMSKHPRFIYGTPIEFFPRRDGSEKGDSFPRAEEKVVG